jgi:hypothetical protein
MSSDETILQRADRVAPLVEQYDPFRHAIERHADRIAAAIPIAHAIVEGRKAAMSLANLKNLAARNRDRLARIVHQAEELDQHGEETEATSKKVLDEHAAVFRGIREQIDEVNKFNSEMKAQLGNS